MAISATHYYLLKQLRERGELPQGGRILEIGKANWYGDLSVEEVVKDLVDYHALGEIHQYVNEQVTTGRLSGPSAFAVGRFVYIAQFGTDDVTSIDLDPSADAIRHDLNCEVNEMYDNLRLHRSYDVCINHGTAEHIFNIANVFRVMHDASIQGGLMIHESPFTGWVDHGFYCLQPTLFWDLAAANNYKMVLMAIEHLASRSIIPVESREQILDLKRRDQLPDNAMLFVAMRKQSDEPFVIPMQGVYAGTLSQDAANAWRELR